MKYIFFSSDGIGLPIAYQLQTEANDVYVGLVTDLRDKGSESKEDQETKKRRLSIMDGMFDVKMDALALLDKMADIPMKERAEYFVIFDFNDLWMLADKVRAMGGYKGFLPTEEDHKIEEDRNYAKDLVKKHYKDIDLQECYEFKTVEEAIEFMREEGSDKPFVSKGYDVDAPTVVPESNDPEVNHKEIIDVLMKNAEAYEKGGFILEEKITDAIEFTPEAVSFDGKLLGLNIDIEAKGLGSGDTGRQTGCSLDLVFWLDIQHQVYEKFLKPMEKYFMRKNELCVWDASILYSPSRNKFYFGEYCGNRWGYNAIFTELCTFRAASDYFEKLVKGELLYGEKGQTKQFGASIRAFNLTDDKKFKGMQTKDSLILTNRNDKNVWLIDVKDVDGTLYNCGLDKDLMVITGSGDTINEAVESAYSLEKKVSWVGKYTRPIHDYLSTVYQTSIINRFNQIKPLFLEDLPDIKWVYDMVEHVADKKESKGFLKIDEKKREEQKPSFIKALRNKKND